MRRARDWALLLSSAALAAAALAALNWFLFIRERAPQEAAPAPRAVSFSREQLDAVLASFERRRLEYEAARGALPPIADPGK